MKKIKLGFIGCGNMAQAIIRALSGERQKQNATERGIEFCLAYSDPMLPNGIVAPSAAACVPDNDALVKESDIVVIAVKPQTAPDILPALDMKNKVIVSIMAGVTVDKLKKLTGSSQIVRVMPNLNARIGKSFNAYTMSGISDETEDVVRLVLESFGTAAKVAENKLNAVTGLTGSSPAFVFMFIKALADAGERLGFDAATARQMAVAAVNGSAELVASCDTDLGELIASVCSKGGTTVEGVNYLNSVDMQGAVGEAVARAVKRAEEL